jgi:hypothetical protein
MPQYWPTSNIWNLDLASGRGGLRLGNPTHKPAPWVGTFRAYIFNDAEQMMLREKLAFPRISLSDIVEAPTVAR